ncbi:LysM peptidoglycan-binding domain-containing protein [Oceaniferula spumae]
MKTIALISTLLALPAASLLAQGQSEFEALRSRVSSNERRIDLLEREIKRLRASDTTDRAATPQKAAPTATTGEYIVVKGDSLSRIATRNKTTVAALKKENGLRSDILRIGQKLRVPGSASVATKAEISSKSAPAVAYGSKHKVRSGETFYSIARDHKVSVQSLIAANPKVRANSLRVGQELSIDGTATPMKTSGAVASKKSQPKAKSPSRSVAKAETSKAAAPKSAPSKPASSTPVSTKSAEPTIRTITVHEQMTYGQFASKYGASTTQLNALNGLSLNKSTMLAKGSELYVPKY